MVSAEHRMRESAPCFFCARAAWTLAAIMPSANVSRYAGSWLKSMDTSLKLAPAQPRKPSAMATIAANVVAGSL